MSTTATEMPFTALDNATRAGVFEAACKHGFESVLVTTARVADSGYPIVYVNQAFTEMTGYSAEEIIGKSPSILQGPKTDAKVLEQLASDIAAGRPFHGRAVNYRKDGSEFMIEWKVIPVADAQDVVTHLVSVQREVD